MANIVCNPVVANTTTAFPFENVEGCYVMPSGPTGATVQYSLQFAQDGRVTESSNLAPSTPGNRGRWLATGDAASNYELRVASGAAPDGVAVGAWLPLAAGRLLGWSYTLSGASGGRFISATLELRRVSDGVVIDTANVDNVQLGVNVECV
ncbi:MAG: hypothetical protein ACOY82_08900 [Pseudomonadota bacterium]